MLSEGKSKNLACASFPKSKAKKSPPWPLLFPSNRNEIFTFALFRNSCKFISRSSSKQQTLPLLKKCQTHKTATCLRRLENEFSRLSPLAGRQSKKWVFLSCQEGGKSVARINSLNSFRFAPVRHLPLTLPVYFSHWPNKKE